MSVKKKVRVRPRFFLILAVFAALVGVGLFFLLRAIRDEVMETGTMRLEHSAKTVLLRDEQTKTAERYDKILFDVAEGAVVNDGDQIAQVFKWGYQEDTMETLYSIQTKIYEYQLSQVEDIVKPELEALQLQIQQKLLETRDAMSDHVNKDMLTLEKELKALLEQRAAMLREIVQPDETLTAFYEQESVQLNNLATWKTDMVNDLGSGVVSFYFDGNEQALNTDKLDMINAQLVEEVLKGSGVMSSIDTTVESPLYRLVNNSHFYIAFLTDVTSPLRLVQGESYTVLFNGYLDRPFTGTALAPTIFEKKVVNMLEFHQEMGDLMGVRVVEATIMKDVTGLRVPVDAIDMQNNLPGILRVSGDATQWVQVDVLAMDAQDAIIRSADPNAPLLADMRYKKP